MIDIGLAIATYAGNARNIHRDFFGNGTFLVLTRSPAFLPFRKRPGRKRAVD